MTKTFKFTDWHWLHHTWTEWSKARESRFFYSFEQFRQCVVCGKEQRRVV